MVLAKDVGDYSSVPCSASIPVYVTSHCLSNKQHLPQFILLKNPPGLITVSMRSIFFSAEKQIEHNPGKHLANGKY